MNGFPAHHSRTWPGKRRSDCAPGKIAAGKKLPAIARPVRAVAADAPPLPSCASGALGAKDAVTCSYTGKS